MKTNESKLTSDIWNYRDIFSNIADSDFKNKPHINADERRFVNLNIQHFSEICQKNGLIKSPQSTQSSAIPITTSAKVT